jgi:hypothetical protein
MSSEFPTRAVATIRATCPDCGDVDLSVPDLKVLVCLTTCEGAYTFQCPGCLLAVSKPAEGEVVDLLLAAGVELSAWDLPAELSEPHDGPPLTTDDLIDLHFALQDDNWMSQLLPD